jgi:hypothetical protein
MQVRGRPSSGQSHLAMQRNPHDHPDPDADNTLRAYVGSTDRESARQSPAMKIHPAAGPAPEVLAALADVSRRIHDLARELKCFGHFDDDPDLPRAA